MTIRVRAAGFLLCLVTVGCASTQSPTPSAPPLTSTPATTLATATATFSPSPGSTVSELVAADLDGVLSDPAVAHRLPLAVSIDDNRVARPQSGFNAASIVWQAPADGYEVRYLLLFQEQDAPEVGPVRSGRLYIAQWAAEQGSALAHYGGDKLSLTWIRANRGALFTDVDGLGAGSSAYHRITSREAPHNAYTTTADLWRVAARLGGAATIAPAVHLRPFRDDNPPTDRGASQSITIPYRTVKVGYVYDPATNAYVRSLDGKTHVDPMDGAPVTARTVVVLYMTFRTDNTIEPGHNRPVLGFVGTGVATIFMEGRAIQGTWSKAGASDPTLILGPDGRELPLIRGRMFMQVVPTGTKIGG